MDTPRGQKYRGGIAGCPLWRRGVLQGGSLVFPTATRVLVPPRTDGRRRGSAAALVGAMAVLCTTAGCLLPQPPPTVNAVTVCGNGTTFCLGGNSFYPYGAAFYSSTSQSGITSNPAGAIALAQKQHLNTVRVVNFLPHDLQSGFTTPVAQATNDRFWLGADAFIADAQHAGLHAWLDLSDFKQL